MTPLQQAAKALITRWHLPGSKGYIDELRKALDAEQAQSVEPEPARTARLDAALAKVFDWQPPQQATTSDERAVLITTLKSAANLLQTGQVDDWDGLSDALDQAAGVLAADGQYRIICTDYANVQTNEAVRYQKRIRDLEATIQNLIGAKHD